jgi:hypothetical protein
MKINCIRETSSAGVETKTEEKHLPQRHGVRRDRSIFLQDNLPLRSRRLCGAVSGCLFIRA